MYLYVNVNLYDDDDVYHIKNSSTYFLPLTHHGEYNIQ
jgi:hypothetical protein